MTTHLRPIERRVLAMRSEGLSDQQIAERFRRSPEHIGRVAEWAAIDDRGPAAPGTEQLLTPMQRRVVTMRAEGQSHAEIGERFRRSERFIRQVEGLARFRQYRDLLG